MGGTISAISENQGLEKGFSDLSNYLEKTYAGYSGLIFSKISMKDSTQITEDDMISLWQEIEQSKSDQIIVTHGTITMERTARFIKQKLHTYVGNKKKAIYFVGSEFAIDAYPTDAILNIGFALGKVEKLKGGIYVHLKGQTVLIERELNHI